MDFSKIINKMLERQNEMIEDALNHFQVNIEDIPDRCEMKNFGGGHQEVHIDGKLALSFKIERLTWHFNKHY